MATPKRKGTPIWLAKQDENDESLNPHYRRSIRYYTKLYQAWPDWADDEKMDLVYEERDRLSLMTGKPYHVDHMVPICSPYVCGLHNEFNLEPMLEKENMQKSNKVWPDMWMEQRALGLQDNRVYQYELPL